MVAEGVAVAPSLDEDGRLPVSTASSRASRASCARFTPREHIIQEQVENTRAIPVTLLEGPISFGIGTQHPYNPIKFPPIDSLEGQTD